MDMVWESTGTPYQKGVSLRETDECLHAVGSTLPFFAFCDHINPCVILRLS